MLFRNLCLPGLLNKNFKSCDKTFDITEFSLIPFQQLATFVSGGDLSPCSRLLKIIKVMTLVCLTATQGLWRGHPIPSSASVLFLWYWQTEKKKWCPTGPLSWKPVSLKMFSNTEKLISEFTLKETVSPWLIHSWELV